MRNAVMALGAMMTALVLSGCPIFIDGEDPEPPDCGWGCADECNTDSDCPSGYICDDGICNASWYCDWDGTCPEGYVCDDRDTCVPGDDGPTLCETNEDCPDGYCNNPSGETGLCVDTGTCTEDADCVAYGPGLACDDRGVCVPDEGPCPDGECGCVEDSECEDGNLCISSRCTDLSTICVFDFECGDGYCMNSACHASCEEGESCPIGQTCEAGICTDLEVGTDDCVFDEDCGGDARCINATCHPTCDGDTCGEGETCRAGVCRADEAPVRNCSVDAGDCDEGMLCIRGFCRMPCANDVNCVDQGDMATCDDGYCRFEEELAPPECYRNTDCYADGLCINGICISDAE